MIYLMESGDRHGSLRSWQRIARVLNVDVHDIAPDLPQQNAREEDIAVVNAGIAEEHNRRLLAEVGAFTAAWLKKLEANGHKPHPLEEEALDLHEGLKREIIEYYQAYWRLAQRPESAELKAELLGEAIDVAGYLLFELMQANALPTELTMSFVRKHEDVIAFFETVLAGAVESAGGEVRISQAQLEDPRELEKDDDPKTGEWIYRIAPRD